MGSIHAARTSMQGDPHAHLLVFGWEHQERCQAARMGGCAATTLLPPPLTLTFFFFRPLVGPSSASANAGTMLASPCLHHHACITMLASAL